MTHPNDPSAGRDYGAAPQYGQYGAAPGQYGEQPAYATQQAYPQYAAPAGPPPSNAGWAVASILFFWPVAFSAFNHLHSIYPRWAMGDLQGAQEASDRVKSLGKIALGIAVGLWALFVIFYVIIIASVISAVPTLR
jgi:hypothetical protein